MRLVGALAQDELGEDGGGEHPVISRFGAQSRLAMREGRIIGLKSERQRILVDDKTVMYIKGCYWATCTPNKSMLDHFPTLGTFPFLVVDVHHVRKSDHDLIQS